MTMSCMTPVSRLSSVTVTLLPACTVALLGTNFTSCATKVIAWATRGGGGGGAARVGVAGGGAACVGAAGAPPCALVGVACGAGDATATVGDASAVAAAVAVPVTAASGRRCARRRTGLGRPV
jgi:hypothetical protein